MMAMAAIEGEFIRIILENYGPFAVLLYLLWKRINTLETNLEKHQEEMGNDVQKNAEKIRELRDKINNHH